LRYRIILSASRDILFLSLFVFILCILHALLLWL
jgi:hypothetical protein